MKLLTLPLVLLLGACTSLTVREPICSPPPIPAELLVPCEEPTLPTDGTFAAVYENYVSNVVGPWARCLRKDDQLIAITRYREQVCDKIKADNAPAAHWWNF
jgi:hypothetical protein